jgi:hypothetical protein
MSEFFVLGNNGGGPCIELFFWKKLLEIFSLLGTDRACKDTGFSELAKGNNWFKRHSLQKAKVGNLPLAILQAGFLSVGG